MLSYCLKCRKDLESKNPKFVKTKNGRIMLLLKHKLCNSKTWKFIKEQETSGLLCSLEKDTFKQSSFSRSFSG